MRPGECGVGHYMLKGTRLWPGPFFIVASFLVRADVNAARGVALMVVSQKIRSEGFQWEVIALDGMKRTNAAEKWSIRLLQAGC